MFIVFCMELLHDLFCFFWDEHEINDKIIWKMKMGIFPEEIESLAQDLYLFFFVFYEAH